MKHSFKILFIAIEIVIVSLTLGQQLEQLRSNNKTSLKPFLIRRLRPKGDGLVKSEFITSKVKVVLTCEPEETIIKLNFTEPFKGVVQAGKSQSSCRIRGDGKLSYVLRVPHNSCGTEHEISKGSFANTLSIRYHPSLEMGGDHIKTIMCNFGTGSFNIS